MSEELDSYTTEAAETELMLRAAWLYHFEGLTQSVIGTTLGVSRARVIKLLKDSFEQGLVTIQMSHNFYNCLRLEGELKATFQLKDAVVVPTPRDTAQLTTTIGQAAATYLPKVLTAGMTLGTAWGSTILATARTMKPHPLEGVSVVMMLGGIPDSLPALNPNDIARLFAERLGGRTYYLYAPTLVEKAATREALLADSAIQAPLRLAKASNVALLGAGTCGSNATLATTGILSGAQLAALRARGAVGDILARFFDIDGRPVPSDIDERIIGLELEDLKRIDTTILVAGGHTKVATILGALRGSYVNTLVSDEQTCHALLACHRATQEVVS